MPNLMRTQRKSYPSKQSPGQVATITFVLVAGGAQDVAAYAGQGDIAWVMSQGDKLSEQEARNVFGDWGDLEYRP